MGAPGRVTFADAMVPADLADTLSDLVFENFSDRGVIVSASEAEDGLWHIQIIVPPDRAWRQVEQELARLHAGPLPDFSLTRLAPHAWQSAPQPGFEPLRAGRFFIHDEAHSPDRPSGHICLHINAALAFGTGHHPTTAGCLIALEKVLKTTRPRTVLDLGCGTAILAIAAAKCLHRPVLATDIDPLAVSVAQQNARANAVAPLIRCVRADGLRGRVFRDSHPFDLVLANILARPLADLAEPLACATAPGSRLILSGLLTTQVRRIAARYRAAGFILQDRLDLKEWATLTLTAPKPPRGGGKF